MKISPLIPTLALAVLLAGCAAPVGLHETDRASLLAAVAKAVPVGTPAADAARALERAGYKCNNNWPGTHLNCRDESTVVGEVFTRAWRLNIAIKDGKVAGHEVGSSQLGL